jgi:hypothetical protein
MRLEILIGLSSAPCIFRALTSSVSAKNITTPIKLQPAFSSPWWSLRLRKNWGSTTPIKRYPRHDHHHGGHCDRSQCPQERLKISPLPLGFFRKAVFCSERGKVCAISTVWSPLCSNLALYPAAKSRLASALNQFLKFSSWVTISGRSHSDRRAASQRHSQGRARRIAHERSFEKSKIFRRQRGGGAPESPSQRDPPLVQEGQDTKTLHEAMGSTPLALG